MKIAVINVSFGSWYPAGQVRLGDYLDKFNFKGDRLFYKSCEELGSPHHSVNHYVFKAYALEKALKEGYDLILWLDASIHLLKPIEPVFDMIEKDGYLFLDNGQWLGLWSSDASLDYFGLTREEAIKMPELTGCILGLDLRTEKGKEFVRLFKKAADDGIFHADWSNANHAVSIDDRVKGHRHDQTCATCIAYKLGMADFKKDVHCYRCWHLPIKETMFFENAGGA